MVYEDFELSKFVSMSVLNTTLNNIIIFEKK